MTSKEIEVHEMHDPFSINHLKLFDIASSISISIPMLQLNSSFFFNEI
jgi:hypothetical protein